MVEERARRAHSSHKQGLEQKASEYPLGPHFPFQSCAFYASRALFKSKTACCFENTLKNGSQRDVIPHFLTFLTLSLRLLYYLHLSSRRSLASVHINYVSLSYDSSKIQFVFLRFFKNRKVGSPPLPW